MRFAARIKDWHDRRINWVLVGWVALVFGSVLILHAFGVEQRVLSMILGFLASAGLTYRLVTTWMSTPVLVHAVTSLLIITLILGAVAQAQIIAESVNVSTLVGWPIVLLRCGCVIVAIKWPTWVDRKYSPLLANPPKHK